MNVDEARTHIQHAANFLPTPREPTVSPELSVAHSLVAIAALLDALLVQGSRVR